MDEIVAEFSNSFWKWNQLYCFVSTRLARLRTNRNLRNAAISNARIGSTTTTNRYTIASPRVKNRHFPRFNARGRNAFPATVVKLRPDSTFCCRKTRNPVTTISITATAAAVLYSGGDHAVSAKM